MKIQTLIIQTINQILLKSGVFLVLTCAIGNFSQAPTLAQSPSSSTAIAMRKTAADKAAFYAGQRAKKAAEIRQAQLNKAGAAAYAAKKVDFYAGQKAKAAKKAAFWAEYYKTHPKAKPAQKK